MDQHLHPQQWHPRPIQGTVCPICAIPHFPFCPPHPSFNQNPKYHFEPDLSFQRPGFDPYRLSMGIPRPFMGNPDDGFADQRSRPRNPSNSYEHVPFQPHREGFVPPPYDYGSNGFVNDAERSYKRPRVDDVNSDGVMHELDLKSGRSSYEDERRLKLVRDHGGSSSLPMMISGSNCETNGRTDESSVIESSFSRPGSGNLDRFDGFHGGKGKWESAGTRNMVLNDFQNSDTGINDARDLGSRRPSENEEFPHSRHDQVGVSLIHDLAHRQESHHSNTDNRQAFSWMDHRNHSIDPIHTRQFSSHGQQNFEGNAHHGTRNFNFSAGYVQRTSGGGRFLENGSPIEDSRLFNEQPPLPASPPPPLPWDAHLHSSPAMSSSLFPVHEMHSLTKPYHYHNRPIPHVYSGSVTEAAHPSSCKEIFTDNQSFGLKQMSSHKPKVVDASHLFKLPYRSTRPGHIVVILRGLPGSGKSYLAKMLRDVEVENGGDAPRIHSMDDYFMTEVEKVEDGDGSSSNSIKVKKPTVKNVMEYCYEPEMEEAYRSSMLKAFKKTLEEGVFTFVIVDDRNLRVADFAQFWAIGKSSGYEVYILEATYKDPAGCAARNVHGFTLDHIQRMARQWEEAPPLYLQLDIKSLCHGDDLKESGIQEVDMDMEDGDEDSLSSLQEMKSENSPRVDAAQDDGKRWDAEPDHVEEEVKELGRSKWSNDLDEDYSDRTERLKGNANALSGLIRAYARGGKSVRWVDQVGNTGFSIGAAKKSNKLSLIMGPGAGYNLKSNPLPEESYPGSSSTHGSSESKKHSKFEERLRAESESFKVVFDKRRQRIGLDWEEE